MLDPEIARERVLLLQQLRELTAERIEKESARQQRMWRLLEEKNRATVERLNGSKTPVPFAFEFMSAPSARGV